MFYYLLHGIRFKTILLIAGALTTCCYIIQVILLHYLSDELNSHPIILWWTPLMVQTKEIINCYDKYTCLLTKDRIYHNNSDLRVLLFYGTQFDIADLPLPKDKYWAIYHEESPRNVGLFLYNRTFELFDITATFSRYSTVPLTLQYLNNLEMITDTRFFVSLKEKNRLLNSIAPVLYIQSDCDTPNDRDLYVSELMKHIKVDSYGACLKNRQFPKHLSEIYPLDLFNEELLKFVAQYKFVLSIENAICEDYITEKLWRPIRVGSIPVYWGSPSVHEWLPNENSAVLIDHFENPQLLANYLHEINRNDSMYSEFILHKSGIVTNQFLKDNLAKGPFGLDSDKDDPIPAFECFVCRAVHEGFEKRKTTKSVYDCAKPKPGNPWESYWRAGDCQSKTLENLVKNQSGDKYCT